jgi:flagellar biosynthesis/type III secretory pathway protein FliH
MQSPPFLYLFSRIVLKLVPRASFTRAVIAYPSGRVTEEVCSPPNMISQQQGDKHRDTKNAEGASAHKSALAAREEARQATRRAARQAADQGRKRGREEGQKHYEMGRYTS